VKKKTVNNIKNHEVVNSQNFAKYWESSVKQDCG